MRQNDRWSAKARASRTKMRKKQIDRVNGKAEQHSDLRGRVETVLAYMRVLACMRARARGSRRERTVMRKRVVA
eukprot:321753-Pleurochrysis_carterae.AAC.1